MEWAKWQTVALTGVFLASGSAALINEIVWLQLGLVLGATSVTLGILLTSFMGGMGLGSLLLPTVGAIHAASFVGLRSFGRGDCRDRRCQPVHPAASGRLLRAVGVSRNE